MCILWGVAHLRGQNMWRPTLDRWRNQRIPGNGERLIKSMQAEGYYP